MRRGGCAEGKDWNGRVEPYKRHGVTEVRVSMFTFKVERKFRVLLKGVYTSLPIGTKGRDV